MGLIRIHKRPKKMLPKISLPTPIPNNTCMNEPYGRFHVRPKTVRIPDVSRIFVKHPQRQRLSTPQYGKYYGRVGSKSQYYRRYGIEKAAGRVTIHSHPTLIRSALAHLACALRMRVGWLLGSPDSIPYAAFQRCCAFPDSGSRCRESAPQTAGGWACR